ncbi:MAG: PUA domain-containing protein [Candidatus Thorarchaeota archaeon]
MVKHSDLQPPTEWITRELRMLAQYQFGTEFSNILFPEGILVTYSRATRKVKEIWFDNERIASYRPTDGFFSLGLGGAKRIVKFTKKPLLRVVVQSNVAQFIADGRNVFAKHVVEVDPKIRPADEVIVVSEEDDLLAVGKAILSAEYMLAFEKGTAVKVRHGIKKL